MDRQQEGGEEIVRDQRRGRESFPKSRLQTAEEEDDEEEEVEEEDEEDEAADALLLSDSVFFFVSLN